MQKYRIYELAKIYNKGNDEIIAVLNKNNIEVKNRLNSVCLLYTSDAADD